MGDLRDRRLAARRASYRAAARAAGMFNNRQSKYSAYGRCVECRFLDTCAVCPVSIGHQPDIRDPDRIPDFLCAFNLIALGYRDRFPQQPDLRAILTGAAPIATLTRELEACLELRPSQGR